MTAVDDFDAKKKGFLLRYRRLYGKAHSIQTEIDTQSRSIIEKIADSQRKEIIVGETTLLYDSLTASTPAGDIELPQKEFYILYKLLSYPGKIFTRSQLMEEFWGADSDTVERTVDVHITRIRDKFKNSKDFEISTIRGLGYKAVKKRK